MKVFHKVDSQAQVAEFDVEATNQFGIVRKFGIAYYVPRREVLQRLTLVPVGTEVNIESAMSEHGAPCAMTMVDFTINQR